MITLTPTERLELQSILLDEKGIDISVNDIIVLENRHDDIDKMINDAVNFSYDAKLRNWYDGNRILTKMDDFRPAALHYRQYGKYTNAVPSRHPKSEWIKFWSEEARRCVHGYHLGYDWITGYHYFYLNYTRIELIKTISDGGRKEEIREQEFPDVWDGDYYFFHYIEEARRHNKHAICLKKRGAGLSFKFASMMVRNYFLIPKSRSQVYANDKGYLLEDGVLSKTWDIMNFVDTNTAWAKKKQVKNTELHKRSSYKRKLLDGTEVEAGWLSEILGRSLKDDPHKARGKRSMLIGFEEFGSQDNGKQIWEVTTPSVEQGSGPKKKVFGQKIAYGCVCAGTKVWTNEGKLINIEDLQQEDGIIGFNKDKGCVAKEKIININPPGKKKCYRIVTQTNRVLECSYDHPLLIKNKTDYRKTPKRLLESKYNVNCSFKQAQYLKVGDNLLVARSVPIFGNKKMFDARLVGMLIGDGCYTENGSTTFYNSDDVLWKYITDKYKVSFNFERENKDGRLFRRGNILNIRKELKNIGILNQVGLDKRLPNNIQEYCKKDICDLIGGLIDTDGCVISRMHKGKHKIEIGYTTISYIIIEELIFLLQKLGIHCYIRKRNPRPNKIGIQDVNPWYELTISDKRSLINFKKNIKLLVGYKQEKVNRITEYYKDIKESITWNDKGVKRDKIISIEDIGERDIYNLTVGRSHTYLVNGIISHNTGGESGSTFEAMKTMIYSPEAYDIFDVPNLWDANSEGTRVGYFWPESVSLEGYMDDDGNTDIKAAKDAILTERDKWKKQNLDGTTVAMKKAEKPLTIQEAILRMTGNMFPTEDVRQQLALVETKPKFVPFKEVGVLRSESNMEVVFEIDVNRSLEPIESLTFNSPNTQGAIIVFERPQKREVDGQIPAGMYIGGSDPVEFNKSEVGKKFSYAATYIMNAHTERIVAAYVCRPNITDDYFEMTRRLAIYYNAKINYENNLKGIFNHFQKKDSLHYLMDCPKYLQDKLNIKFTSTRAKGTPASERINEHARMRIRDWLLRESVVNPEFRNIDYLYDKRLLNELVDWNDKGNFDAISAVGMLMIALDESSLTNRGTQVLPTDNLLKADFWKLKLSTPYSISL